MKLNIFCTSAVKLCYAKSTKSPFMFSHLPEFIGEGGVMKGETGNSKLDDELLCDK